MQTLDAVLLGIHILAGTVSLVTGLLAILSAKGKKVHKKSGKVYAMAMAVVFVTGIIVATFRYNRFLFLIAFLSYYSVFCGVRALKLKQLHRGQKAKWYDWFAGICNAVANLVFIGLGMYYGLKNGFGSGGAILSLGFGFGGLFLSYTNLHPFVVPPKKAYHWYLAHVGNMMGGYIATFTAFLSTIVTNYNLMNPYVAFALPSLIGIPLLVYWQKRTERTFTKAI